MTTQFLECEIVCACWIVNACFSHPWHCCWVAAHREHERWSQGPYRRDALHSNSSCTVAQRDTHTQWEWMNQAWNGWMLVKEVLCSEVCTHVCSCSTFFSHKRLSLHMTEHFSLYLWVWTQHWYNGLAPSAGNIQRFFPQSRRKYSFNYSLCKWMCTDSNVFKYLTFFVSCSSQ